jgi:hypothetical protein
MNDRSTEKSLQELSNDPDKKRDNHAQNDHGCDGKIKFKIFFFDADVTWKSSKPIQFVPKKINKNTCYNND